MAEQRHLTGKVVERWPVPDEGRVEVMDEKTPGLRVRISAGGRRTWYYYRSHGGKPVRRAIGDWPEWSATAARREAVRLSAELGGYGPPVEDRTAERRAGRPLVEVWEAYLADGKLRGRKPKAMANDEYLWGRGWRQHEKTPVDLVTRAVVAEVQREIGAEHQVLANRVVKLLSRVWRWGVRTQMIGDGPVPTERVELFRERPRGRFLQGEEAETFVKELMKPETAGYLRDFVELALATGARKSSLLQMEWADVHGDLWFVRGETMKTGDPLVLPLLPLAVAALERRRQAVRKGCPYVFPGRGTGRPMTDVKVSWATFRARAGLPDLRIHDLRRTLGSWMSMEGESLTLVGRALGHRSSESTEVYAQLRTAPVREAMERGLGALLAAAEVQEELSALDLAKLAVGGLGDDDLDALREWLGKPKRPER